MTVIDLTHPITSTLPVYFPWHPSTSIEQTATYDQNLCEVRSLTIGTHTGTHIDAPSHVLEGMPTLDQYDPRLWVSEATVIDCTPRTARQTITRDELVAKPIVAGQAVIIKTGWDVYFGREDYYSTFPPLSNDGAEYLVEMRVPLVAADTPFSLDVHKILLRHGIPLVTNINNSSQLREGQVKLVSAPLLIKGGDGAPARVMAVIGS
jgi:arylformamidase